jgi:dTDP-4-amino-4,6-dideoxygalactose transaminase
MKIEVYSPTIRRKEMDAVLTALVEDRIGPGEQTRLLIQIAREKLGFDYCIALRSPVIALFSALSSLGLEEGRGVILSALSPQYYQNVLNNLKLKGIYADVQPGSALMSRETVEKAVQSKPEGCDVRAIILHHTLGYLPNVQAVSELGIPVIEDCSQSYGALGRQTAATAGAQAPGTNGVFTILGLEERDMLTSGGGALLYAFNRRDASALRNMGELPPEYGLPDMNAAMGVVQFREAHKNLDRRREIAKVYNQAASRTRHKCFVQSREVTPTYQDAQSQGDLSQEDCYNNYAFSLILETGMKDVKAYARRKEIVVENAFENTLAGSGMVPMEQCPEACSLSLRTVLFPLYPRLRAEEVERVSKLITTLP